VADGTGLGWRQSVLGGPSEPSLVVFEVGGEVAECVALAENDALACLVGDFCLLVGAAVLCAVDVSGEDPVGALHHCLGSAGWADEQDDDLRGVALVKR
jgi:hypothetical protein